MDVGFECLEFVAGSYVVANPRDIANLDHAPGFFAHLAPQAVIEW
jgi:hypothetical protein